MIQTLWVPDQHIPYNDLRYWKLLLKVAKAKKFHRIVILGDFGDFYCTSRHLKSPDRTQDLEWEIAEQNKALDELDALGAKEKLFILGNHENNLSRFLSDKAPQLFNIVKVEKLLKLRERGWRTTAYMDHTRVGKVYVTHETGSSGERAHITSSNKFKGSVVIGHTHRCAINYSMTLAGKGHVAAMVGWGGDPKKAEYMHRVSTTDWTLGFGVGTEDSAGAMHLQACPVIDYRVIVDGVQFTG